MSELREPYWHDDHAAIYHGDAREVLAEMDEGSVDSIVTSPPYWGLRNYCVGQYGQEPTSEAYVENLRATFAEARRVLADDGTCWLNVGDCYAANSDGWSRGRDYNPRQPEVRPKARLAVPPKNLLGMPWRVAFALQEDGWILRNAIVWSKPNAMPQSVRDRMSNRYELIFLLVKQQHGTAMRPTGEPHAAAHPNGRNPGDVWSIPTRPLRAEHFAAFPIDIPLRAIAAGCRPGGTVLDPFTGSGTTGIAARQLGRQFAGIELHAPFIRLAGARIREAGAASGGMR
ncbi:DNA-methyltransferase [Microbispora sp. H10885]|uniref:DNA-methyltransferase n=1 Tax=Microbispora sp. H10885 TaxID=2729110 RepID=UPI001C71FA83|nr:site-specific DNA-methyltransferase [Microbispora sp. H10885]